MNQFENPRAIHIATKLAPQSNDTHHNIPTCQMVSAKDLVQNSLATPTHHNFQGLAIFRIMLEVEPCLNRRYTEETAAQKIPSAQENSGSSRTNKTLKKIPIRRPPWVALRSRWVEDEDIIACVYDLKLESSSLNERRDELVVFLMITVRQAIIIRGNKGGPHASISG